MEKKKALVTQETLETVGHNDRKKSRRRRRRTEDKKVQPYMFLLPIAIVTLVVMAISVPFSNIAMTIVICLTMLAFTAIVGMFIYSLIKGGDKVDLGNSSAYSSLSPKQLRSEWIIEQSLLIADNLKTRTMETQKTDGTVQRITEELPEKERQQLMTILEKALINVQDDELPSLEKVSEEPEELELEAPPTDEDFIL